MLEFSALDKADPAVRAAALERATLAVARLDATLDGHPLLPAWQHWVRLEAVCRFLLKIFFARFGRQNRCPGQAESIGFHSYVTVIRRVFLGETFQLQTGDPRAYEPDARGAQSWHRHRRPSAVMNHSRLGEVDQEIPNKQPITARRTKGHCAEGQGDGQQVPWVGTLITLKDIPLPVTPHGHNHGWGIA
ncbi:hypothetical protein ACCD06_18960 [Azospirillum sp. CT11-132]|uniref:hypothetical protein n=1 Tax=Azospirillum sp. CT11-132 TaxID=3396317 RepID=UPI0039A4437E